MTEQENRIIQEFEKKFVKTEFGKGRYLVKVPPKYVLDFILSKIKEAEDRKVEEIVREVRGLMRISGTEWDSLDDLLEELLTQQKQ